MAFPLAFDQDPLFSDLSNPLIKIETRLTRQKQRLWFWKTNNFFWFWNEDEPDFFGVLFEATEYWSFNRRWFREAFSTNDSRNLREILRRQLHHGEWARAITTEDPRPEKSGVWRILWRRRQLILQNAFSGRAVNIFPETNWHKEASQWRQLNCFAHNAQFFAEIFWPLLTERRGRLKTAFEFLELPTDYQDNPIRFGRRDRTEFLSVMRAALLISHRGPCWGEKTALTMRLHHRTLAPVLNYFEPVRYNYTQCIEIPKFERLAGSFEPYLPADFSLQNVLPSPLALFAPAYEPSIQISIQGTSTSHEELEAHLTVRHWVSQNAPELLADWK